MKKGFLFGIIFALFIFIESAYADSCDVLDMFDGTYVGVGAIDMQKMPDREIYGTLMSFFMTDPEAHKVLVDLEKSGLSSKSVRRIVVGIPADVERAEFLMIWETMSSIKPYVPVLEKYAEEQCFTYSGCHLCRGYAGRGCAYAAIFCGADLRKMLC